VFLGHALLVPALLAGVAATMGVVRPGAASDALELERRAVAELEAAGVPAAIARSVAAHELPGEGELDALSSEQRQGVRRAQMAAAASRARASMGRVAAGPHLAWIVGLAVSCGVTGLALVRKRSVTCCASCGAPSR